MGEHILLVRWKGEVLHVIRSTRYQNRADLFALGIIWVEENVGLDQTVKLEVVPYNGN